MNVNRGQMLARLTEASVGLSTREVLEQSNAFVFKGDRLYTFNDSVMARVASPLDFDAIVNASDLMGILGKIPDDEVDISLNGGEIRIKGKRRTAGISCATEVHLPIEVVPSPEKVRKLTEGTPTMLQQAARTCGRDETQYLTTCVHITPELIEACDNYRLFRVEGPTGFPEDVLIPAHSLGAIEDLDLEKVGVGRGWVHFRTQSGAEISLRCSHESYHRGMDKLLDMDASEQLTLPSNLKDIIERAEVFNTSGYDARLNISIDDGELVLLSRKEGGWYRERKKIRYEGRPLNFDINPKFLVELLNRTREVQVNDRKMRIQVDRMQFLVALRPAEVPTEQPKTESNAPVDSDGMPF